MIDLKQNWFHMLIDHDIKAEYLKAMIVVQVISLAEAIHMLKHWLSNEQSLYNYFVDFIFDAGNIVSAILHDIKNWSQRAFVAYTHVLLACVEHELFIVFIDSVIG